MEINSQSQNKSNKTLGAQDIAEQLNIYKAANQSVLIYINNGSWALVKYAGKGNVALVRSKIDERNITKILGNAFSEREDLVSVFIDEGITTICENAFKNCKSLCFAALPKSLKSIHQNAFAGCNNLSRVLVPKMFCNSGIIISAFRDSPISQSYVITTPAELNGSDMVILSAKEASEKPINLKDTIESLP